MRSWTLQTRTSKLQKLSVTRICNRLFWTENILTSTSDNSLHRKWTLIRVYSSVSMDWKYYSIENFKNCRRMWTNFGFAVVVYLFGPQSCIENLVLFCNKQRLSKMFLLCAFRYFMHGLCKEGDNCRYSHDLTSSKPATMICKFFQKGNCVYGDRCR